MFVCMFDRVILIVIKEFLMILMMFCWHWCCVCMHICVYISTRVSILYVCMLVVFSFIRLTTWFMYPTDVNDILYLWLVISLARQHWTTLRRRASKMSWYVFHNSINHLSWMRAQTHLTYTYIYIFMFMKLNHYISYCLSFVMRICDHLYVSCSYVFVQQSTMISSRGVLHQLVTVMCGLSLVYYWGYTALIAASNKGHKDIAIESADLNIQNKVSDSYLDFHNDEDHLKLCWRCWNCQHCCVHTYVCVYVCMYISVRVCILCYVYVCLYVCLIEPLLSSWSLPSSPYSS